MELDLELESAVSAIKKEKPHSLLLQLPDGLKPKAELIIDYLISKTNVKRSEIAIWAGSCFGACDIPNTDFDLLIQFGHSKWSKAWGDLK